MPKRARWDADTYALNWRICWMNRCLILRIQKYTNYILDVHKSSHPIPSSDPFSGILDPACSGGWGLERTRQHYEKRGGLSWRLKTHLTPCTICYRKKWIIDSTRSRSSVPGGRYGISYERAGFRNGFRFAAQILSECMNSSLTTDNIPGSDPIPDTLPFES